MTAQISKRLTTDGQQLSACLSQLSTSLAHPEFRRHLRPLENGFLPEREKIFWDRKRIST